MALDADRAAELFSALGPVRVRKMFGGVGVYAGDIMFALEARHVLYLKSDCTTGPDFDREGCEAFSYETKHGGRTITSYRRVPDTALEDPEEMATWARRALAIARAKKPKTARK